MRGLVKTMAVLAALVLLPSAAYAQASITGTVKDSSGAVLPGVTVEAAGPTLLAPRSVVTEGNGIYRIIDLPPGTYTTTYSLTGFTKVVREGLELAGSAVVTINTEMKVGAVTETVTVTGETPVVDVQSTKRETVLSSDVIAGLPATRAYGALLNAVAGLTVDTNGLAATPTMTFFSARGGQTNEGKMTINGMTVAAAFNGGGVSSLTYDANNVDEVSVLVSGGLGETDTGGPIMNLVPRSGGNRFAGQAFWNGAGDWSRGDNIDDALRSVGITQGPGIISSYDVNTTYGGPIKRDRLWFWGGYRKFSTAQGVEGIFANAYAGNAAHWDYLRDDSVPARNVQGRDIYQARFTAQITPKNRIMFSQENQYRCEGSTLTPSGNGCRTRGTDWIALGSTTPAQSPESNTGYFNFPYWVTQGTWTSPATSKLLLEAGYTRFAYRHAGGPGQLPPDGIFNLIPVTEQSAIDNHRANFTYRGLGSYFDNFGNPNNWRASASYVTGSHSMKIGYQGAYLIADTTTLPNDSQLIYRFNNRIPNQFTFRLPMWQTADRTSSTALYVQDTWTLGRLTVQGALRYDRASSFSPGEHNGTTATSRFNAQPIAFDRTDSVNAYNDISPRFGMAYDLFGNGKTALKFNLGRYLDAATNDSIYTTNNPAQTTRIVTTVARTWADSNGNFVVDCDILNPALQTIAGGDTCGAITGNSLNFGKVGSNLAQVNPALLHGWGVRRHDGQWGVNVQQELRPRVSLDVGYNRRWFGGFTVTDNLVRDPSQYDKWVITAPKDPRLPGGGGYPITLYTATAAASALAAQNYVTFETDYGPERINYWHGVDVTLNARLRQGLTLQFGTSTGRTILDTCATVVKIDSPDPRNCRSEDPFETTLRGLASYTIPKIGVLVAATMRSQPPLRLSGLVGGANWNVPNTVVQSILGRLPPNGLATGNTTVALIDNDTRMYAENRRTQVDMRFAKIVRAGRTRTDIGADLGNLLNTNYATVYESQFDYATNGGTWLNPTSIVGPRFVRLNVTVNF